jgi:hypothetical protein
MSVWICVPSKRPAEVVAEWAAAWRKQGYKVALYVDADDFDAWAPHLDTADVWLTGWPYPGYAQAVNELVARVLHDYPDCNWIVTGGDDVYPDPNHTADEIARECEQHFVEVGCQLASAGAYGQLPEHLRFNRDKIRALPTEVLNKIPMATFGVCQPTGDRYGEQPNLPADHPMRGAYADRVCGSPWMGREFCLRINQGRGPLWPEYTHMFEDEELQAVSTKLGVLWQRRDLTQYHKHWARERQERADMPEFLKSVNTQEHWAKYRALFESRKAAGFPGSEPL